VGGAEGRVGDLPAGRGAEAVGLGWRALRERFPQLAGPGEKLRALEVAPLVEPEEWLQVVLEEEALVVDADTHELDDQAQDEDDGHEAAAHRRRAQGQGKRPERQKDQQVARAPAPVAAEE